MTLAGGWEDRLLGSGDLEKFLRETRRVSESERDQTSLGTGKNFSGTASGTACGTASGTASGTVGQPNQCQFSLALRAHFVIVPVHSVLPMRSTLKPLSRVGKALNLFQHVPHLQPLWVCSLSPSPQPRIWSHLRSISYLSTSPLLFYRSHYSSTNYDFGSHSHTIGFFQPNSSTETSIAHLDTLTSSTFTTRI